MSREGDMPMPMSNGTMNMKDMMTMHMSFYWGKDAIILFQGWPNHSRGMYILALFFVFLLSLAIEVLSVSQTAKSRRLTIPMVVEGFAQAIVYALRTALAYMVMLSVMSFNLGIFIAAVAGHTIGFFLVKYQALAVAARADATENTAPKV